MEKRISKRWWTMVTLALVTFAAVTAAQQKTKPDLDVQLKAASQKEIVDGDPKGAIALYQKIVDNAEANHVTAAKALLEMGRLYGKLGKPEDEKKAYDRVLKDYSDQKDAVLVARTGLGGDVRSTSNAIVLSTIWTDNKFRFEKVSPDGRYLVGRSKTGLRIHDVSLGKDRFLESTDGNSWSPCFTPDSKRIVYVSGKDGDVPQEIRVINIDGTGEQKTIWKSTEYSTVEVTAISRDGKLAAVNLFMDGPIQSGWWKIGLVSLETGKSTILTTRDLGLDAYVGNFSPDGRWLVYTSEVSTELQGVVLYAIAVDGSDQQPLVSRLATKGIPFFTPDGSRVVFANRGALYSIRFADGKALGDPEIVKENVGGGLGFTRDGSFYFGEGKSQNSVYVAEVDASTWKLRNPPKEISTPFRHPSGQPAWSLNGRLLAFEDERKLVIHDFDSGSERELADNGRLRGWLPDNKSVLLAESLSRGGVRLFDTTTHREQPLSLPDTAARNLEFFGQAISSTDGKYLFYFTNDDAGSTNADGPVHLIRRGLQTNDEKELYRFEARGGIVSFLTASPDGLYLSFGYRKPGETPSTVLVFPLAGGEPRLLSQGGSWTQDSKAMLFVRSDEIWVQPIDGGPAYGTGIRIEGLNSPSVHPDGSRIAFLGSKSSSTVWKIQNLFPQISATK